MNSKKKPRAYTFCSLTVLLTLLGGISVCGSETVSLETEAQTLVSTKNSVLVQTEPVSIRTFQDYWSLRDFPLPDLPVSIQTLEHRLEAKLKTYSGTWSVYIKNLSTEDTILLNDVPMKSASVMKLFIMGTVYDSINSSQLERTENLMTLLSDMICYSSNEASNQLLALLGNGSYENGIRRVNQFISSRRYEGETHEYNGFNDPATILDEDHFNQVSAKDCGQLLEEVYHRTFASRSICNEIETMMLNQNTRYKIPAGIPENVSVGNKTGEMDTVENDVAVIYGDRSDYILCILSSDWNSKEEALRGITELSSMVYDFFDDDAYYQDSQILNLSEYNSDAPGSDTDSVLSENSVSSNDTETISTEEESETDLSVEEQEPITEEYPKFGLDLSEFSWGETLIKQQ